MTLTLADLDRWDPNAIHSVFQAAIDRANGVRSTATQVGDVVAATPWEGDSHDAALGATGRIQDDLLNHAEECEAAAMVVADSRDTAARSFSLNDAQLGSTSKSKLEL